MSKYPIFVFEGIEGTGKSTQVRSISVYLKKKRVPFIILREPGGSKNSEKIRDFILNKNINFHNIYIPLNIYKIFSSNKIKCVEAEKYYNDSLCIPIYFSLKKYVAKKIIKIINEFK